MPSRSFLAIYWCSNCSSITWNGGRLKQKVIWESKNVLVHFSKGLKIWLLLHQNCSKPPKLCANFSGKHTKITVVLSRYNSLAFTLSYYVLDSLIISEVFWNWFFWIHILVDEELQHFSFHRLVGSMFLLTPLFPFYSQNYNRPRKWKTKRLWVCNFEVCRWCWYRTRLQGWPGTVISWFLWLLYSIKK